MNYRKPMQLRLPEDLKEWIKAESDRNGSSQNSEVIRAIRAAKDRRRDVLPLAQGSQGGLSCQM